MRTIEWSATGTVCMIDQRKLPLELAVVECTSYQEVARAIQDMTIRGAPAIGAAAAFGLALAALHSPASTSEALLADLEGAARVLAATRPTAVNLFWAIERMLARTRAGQPLPLQDQVQALIAEAQAVADEDVEINRRMGAHGAALIADGFHILTHCNAGALATVDYGTVLAVVRTAHEQGKKIHVWVDETRPRLQGASLTAWELMRDGIPMTLIADNASGHLMRTGRVDIVLVGSDRTAANGDVANKIGTYKLAVLARENGIPFYPVVPTSTIDLAVASGDDIPIEERDPREITHVRGCQIAPDGVRVYNPAFDVTPHRYVTGIITENGIAYPPFGQSLRRMVLPPAAPVLERSEGAGHTSSLPPAAPGLASSLPPAAGGRTSSLPPAAAGHTSSFPPAAPGLASSLPPAAGGRTSSLPPAAAGGTQGG